MSAVATKSGTAAPITITSVGCMMARNAYTANGMLKNAHRIISERRAELLKLTPEGKVKQGNDLLDKMRQLFLGVTVQGSGYTGARMQP